MSGASDYLIGLDIGTSMTKAALFDRDGREIACVGQRTRVSSPHPGWFEMDPEDLFAAAARACREVVATAGVPPRIMGIGPAPATQALLDRLGLTQQQLDVIELNEAFASQGLATLRQLGIADDDSRVNRNGGAIALGHPLGMSGARIAGTAALELSLAGGRYAVATMCIGVGQGIAIALERA